MDAGSHALRLPCTNPSPSRPDMCPQVVQIQRLGEEVVSGVVSVDRGEQPDDLGRIALLAAGDGAALLAFAGASRGASFLLGFAVRDGLAVEAR